MKVHKWSPGFGIVCIWPGKWPPGDWCTVYRWREVTCLRCLKHKRPRKITERMVEAGLRAEWKSFSRLSSTLVKTWPDGCPPSSRERWRKAFAVGLRAAIRAGRNKT